MAASLMALLPSASFAQAQSNARPGATPAQPTADQLRRFVSTFETNLYKGCVQGAGNQPNSQSACRCYASSFIRRFEPQELFKINNAASRSPQAVQLISLMMAPDRRACFASQR